MWNDGNVMIFMGFKKVYEIFVEGGWLVLILDLVFGG